MTRHTDINPARQKKNGPRWLMSCWMGVVLFVSGCSATAPVVVENAPYEPEGPTSWSEVETVEMARYPNEPVVKNREIQHEVPQELMSSTADSGLLEDVDGFRIQVFASEVRDNAAQAEEDVRQWIRSLSEERRTILGIKTSPTIYSTYKQPYYRVRMGNFLTRAEAQPVLTALRSRFSGALIVPDVVQVRR